MAAAVKLYQYFQILFWNMKSFHKISDKSRLKVGIIKSYSEFQKLYVRRSGNRKHGFFITWIFYQLKLGNSIKPNVWYFRSLVKLAIKMCFPFNFAKKIKGRHFVVAGSKNLKLSRNTCFGVSFQKIVSSSFLLFLSVRY